MEKFVFCGEKLESWVLVCIKSLLRSLCVAVLSLGKKGSRKVPVWNVANGWKPECGWPLSVLVQSKSVAKCQRTQSELCCGRMRCYEIQRAPQKVTNSTTSWDTHLCCPHSQLQPWLWLASCPRCIFLHRTEDWCEMHLFLYAEPMDTTQRKTS